MEEKYWAKSCRTSNYFCAQGSFTPSGYLLKALFIHSGRPKARYSDPIYDSDSVAFASFPLGPTPDYFQGYGGVTLTNILPLHNGKGLHPRLSLVVYDNLDMTAHTTFKSTITFTKGDQMPLRVL